MIPKSSKFPLRLAFTAHKQRSKQLSTPHLRSLYSPHNPARLAVIVPKKLSKLATTRNWLKRLTYDTLWPTVQGKKLDVVVIYKPLALKKSLLAKQQIITELQSLIPTS